MFSSIVDDFKNAWSRPNNAVVQLILINVIVFIVTSLVWLFFQQTRAHEIFSSMIELPSYLPKLLVRPWTLFTYMFVHAGFWHIVGNMLMLYWFGKLIQEYLGSSKVVALYVLGGLAGGILYIISYNLIPYFDSSVAGSTLVGASAGVLAVVVGAAVFMPDFTFFMLLFGPVKIKYIALIAVFLSFIGLRGGNAGGEIAHLGGVAMGWLFITQLKKGNDLGAPILNFFTFIKSFFVRQPKIKVTHRSGTRRASKKASGSSSSKTEQEEIDAILDKISQSGYESLTKEEKQKLFNASKK